MDAEIITVSSHLLRGQAIDENTAFLTRELTAMGIPVKHSGMLRTDAQELKNALEIAEERSQLIIVSGGLGPDKDDITKTAISEYLDVPLVLDNDTEDRIITYHQNSDFTMPKYNQLQAMILMGATPLRNVTGLAAGFFFKKEKYTYIVLPGPFDELKPMFIENTRPLIIEKVLNDPVIKTKKFSLYGLTESQVTEQLSDVITYDGNPFVGVYYEEDEAEVQITARADSEDEAEEMLEEASKKVQDCVGEHIYGEDEERLSHVVKQLLQEQNKTITAAESLTGGAFLEVISGEPESGDIFEGGIVTYSENIKHNALKVSEETLNEHGVVSAQCAIEMAENSMKMFEADLGISLTGVAGPSSLNGEIPGTVWIGVAQEGKEAFAKRYHFGYKRERNRKNSVLAALNLARLALLGEPIENQVFFDETGTEEETEKHG
ncbi:MAG TPA: competence/damage-inducible protein A [Atopostipes sp.]|nr:competence/damage-inducible protein A [Atopostipes sp.]